MTQVRRTSQPAREILAYFLRNPSAVDSAEGIAQWRLLEETIYREVPETQAALDWLVGKGFLMERTQPSTGRLFCLNPEKRDDAERFLEKRRQKRPGRTGAN